MNNMKIKCDHCHETDCMHNIIELMVLYCKLCCLEYLETEIVCLLTQNDKPSTKTMLGGRVDLQGKLIQYQIITRI